MHPRHGQRGQARSPSPGRPVVRRPPAAPSPSSPTGGTVWASSSTTPTGTIGALTTANLQTIYSSTTGTSTIDGSPVEGCLTITGSTPRSNLESAIGVLRQHGRGRRVRRSRMQPDPAEQRQRLLHLRLHAGTSTDAVIPISAGDWIAQANGGPSTSRTTARSKGLTLASITDGSNALGSPFSGHGTKPGPEHHLLLVDVLRLQPLHGGAHLQAQRLRTRTSAWSACSWARARHCAARRSRPRCMTTSASTCSRASEGTCGTPPRPATAEPAARRPPHHNPSTE